MRLMSPREAYAFLLDSSEQRGAHHNVVRNSTTEFAPEIVPDAVTGTR